jgi:hypothetical protein
MGFPYMVLIETDRAINLFKCFKQESTHVTFLGLNAVGSGTLETDDDDLGTGHGHGPRA